MRWRFDRWQDGDVNTSKVVTLEGDMTLTAYYEEIVPEVATIRGYVKDATTGQPIAGATITCDGYSDVTEIDGSYEFTNIPAVSYTMTIQKEGYQTQTYSVNASAGGTYTINFELAPPTHCFIATVAYGSNLAPQLNVLRRFRDKCLPDMLVTVYYHVGAHLASWIKGRSAAKRYVREVLNLLVRLLKNGV